MTELAADIAELAIGAAGTFLYLTLWRVIQRRSSGQDEARARQRRRLAQLLFFLGLTPWVLGLFWLMERAGEVLRGAPAG